MIFWQQIDIILANLILIENMQVNKEDDQMKQQNVIDRVVGSINKISQKTAMPASLLLLLMMLIIVFRVVGRLTGFSIRGSFEIIGLLAILIATCSIIFAAYEGSVVIVDILISRFSKTGKAVAMVITDIVGIGFWGLVGWASLWYIQTIGRGEETMDLAIHYAPFKIVWIIGCAFYCLIFIKDIFQVIFGAHSK